MKYHGYGRSGPVRSALCEVLAVQIKIFSRMAYTVLWRGHVKSTLIALLLAAIVPSMASAQDPLAPPPEGPQVSLGERGFSVESPGFKLKLGVYFHIDARIFAEGDPQGIDTLVLRRARPVLEGTLFWRLDYRLMVDFGDGRTSLEDAYVDARALDAQELVLRLGKFKAPFGLDRLLTDTATWFVERGYPTQLVPNRDVGVMVWGDVVDGLLHYDVGVFDGALDGGSLDTDADNGKDLAVRLFVKPLRTIGVDAVRDLGIGGAITYGSVDGTDAAPSLPQIRTPGLVPFFRYLADATLPDSTVVADGERFRATVQGSWYWGRLSLLGEWVLSQTRARIGANAARLTNTAWEAQASFLLTDDVANEKGVEPRSPLDIAAGTWGAFELLAQITGVKLDSGSFPAFASPDVSARAALTFVGGLTWYANRSFRLLLNIDHTRFDGGAAAGADRGPETVFLARAQARF